MLITLARAHKVLLLYGVASYPRDSYFADSCTHLVSLFDVRGRRHEGSQRSSRYDGRLHTYLFVQRSVALPFVWRGDGSRDEERKCNTRCTTMS